MGDVLGGGSNGGRSNYEIRGTVESVDRNNQSVYLTNVSGYTSMLSNGGGGSAVRVYFDNDTRVDYQGKSYRPEDLERGDEVVVRVDESGNRLMANTMTVTYDATRDSGSSYPSNSGSTYGQTVRGVVRYVDTSRRTLELERSGMSTVMLEFDQNAPVYFNGQTYRVSDLERGDEVEVRVRDFGGTRGVVQDITVVRNVSGGSAGVYGGSNSQQRSTIRGTVRSIDTARRTFELESASWISGFNRGAGSGVNRFTVQYGDNTQISVNGRLHPMNGLERGDVVEVEVSGNGSMYWAERVTLVRDVNNR